MQWVYNLSPRKWQVLFVKPKTLVRWPFWQVQLESPCSRKASWVGVIRKPSLQPSLQNTRISRCHQDTHLWRRTSRGLDLPYTLTPWSHINLSLQGEQNVVECKFPTPWTKRMSALEIMELDNAYSHEFPSFFAHWVFCCFLQLAVVLPDLVTKLPSKGRTLLQALWTLCWCALFHKLSLHHSDFLKKKLWHSAFSWLIFSWSFSLLLINHLEKAMLPGQKKNPSGNSRGILHESHIGMSSKWSP